MYLEDGLRSVVVLAAIAEIGPGDIPKYWAACGIADEPYPKHWCGAFALWAIKQAGLAPGVKWVIAKGFASNLPLTKSPQPGDIFYDDRPWQHHALVELATSDIVTTIDGNQPEVCRRTRPKSAAVYYSIQPYIDTYLKGITPAETPEAKRG